MVLRCRETSSGQGQHAENGEQAHQAADADQAVGTSHPLFFPDRTDARSGHWAVHEPLRVRTSTLTGINRCETSPRGDPNSKPPIPPSKFFLQSKTQYPPGYEAKSLAEDPLFRQLGGDGTPPFNSDDLRLREESPARGKGIRSIYQHL
jgi:hypothetical protein